jgi:uncharacterized membrane protein YcaP (DUF421 family)
VDAVVRSAAIYLFLVVLFRIAGRRTLAQATTFDLILLLILSEATQQGLLGDDFSVTNAVLVIIVMVGLDILFATLKRRFPGFDRLIEGTPIILVQNGEPYRDRMHKARVGLDDVLQEARLTQGLERMDQIKYAVLERGGSISIVPR